MEWIKVTPETMPPENTDLLVTIFYGDCEEPVYGVWADVRWSVKNGWQYLSNAWDSVWSPVEDGEITHWMLYPKPAQD